MEIIVRVIEKGALEKFRGAASGEEVSKVDVTLGHGSNRIIATAFDKTALEIAATDIDTSYIYVADISFSVAGSERKFQNVRLNKLTAF